MNSILSYRTLLTSVKGLGTAKRFFQTSKGAFSAVVATERNTVKPLTSRKTFLIDYYKHIFDENEIVLFVHRNNLLKAENDKYRDEIRACGATFTVVKNSLMKVYLKNQHHADPASKAATKSFLKKRKQNKQEENPLVPLLKGPTGLISFAKCEPANVAKVLKFLRSTNEKLFLIGGKVEQKTFDVAEIDAFKNLKNKDELQAELVGVLTLLSGAGLVRTLETSQQMLYMTLKSHESASQEASQEPSAEGTQAE